MHPEKISIEDENNTSVSAENEAIENEILDESSESGDNSESNMNEDSANEESADADGMNEDGPDVCAVVGEADSDKAVNAETCINGDNSSDTESAKESVGASDFPTIPDNSAEAKKKKPRRNEGKDKGKFRKLLEPRVLMDIIFVLIIILIILFLVANRKNTGNSEVGYGSTYSEKSSDAGYANTYEMEAANYAGAAADEAAIDFDVDYTAQSSLASDVSMKTTYDIEESVSPESVSSDVTSAEEAVDLSQRKIAFSCDMTIETVTYADTVSFVRKAVDDVGGFISGESESDVDSGWFIGDHTKTRGTLSDWLEIRVPSSSFRKFLDQIESGTDSKVTSKIIQAQDLTRSWSDAEMKIDSLHIQIDRLSEMLKDAKKVSDMLEIEDRLAQAQTELAQFERSLSGMSLDVEYSTVRLSIVEVLEYVPDQPEYGSSTFGKRLVGTIAESWHGLLSFFESVLFAIIRIAPYVGMCILAYFAVRAIVRNRHRRNKI